MLFAIREFNFSLQGRVETIAVATLLITTPLLTL